MSKAQAAGTAPADELDDDIPADLEDLDLADGADNESEPEPEETDPEAETTGEASPDEGEQQITFGDEPEASGDDTNAAPDWVRELRKQNKQLVRERDEARAEAQRARPEAARKPKPELKDFDFDEAKYDAAMRDFLRQDMDAEIAEQRRKDAEKEAGAAWQRHVATVNTEAAGLKVGRADEAKQAFEDELNTQQQAIVLHGPADPKTAAMLRHALGANPKELHRMAAIKDPVKFAFAVSKLELSMKTTAAKRVAPAPERAVTGSGRLALGAVGKRLEALREEAAKSGDISKVMAFKKKLKARGKG